MAKSEFARALDFLVGLTDVPFIAWEQIRVTEHNKQLKAMTPGEFSKFCSTLSPVELFQHTPIIVQYNGDQYMNIDSRKHPVAWIVTN